MPLIDFRPAAIACIALAFAAAPVAAHPAAPQPQRVAQIGPEAPIPESPVPGSGESFFAAPWRYIIIHHSASPSGNARSFDAMHRRKGWDAVAYHFVITNGKGGTDGGLEVTPRWWQQKHGAHAGALPANALPDERNEFNEFGIGICLVGNFEKAPPSRRQLATLTKLLRSLRDKFAVEPQQIVGHRHVKQTACPGRYFPWRQVFAAVGAPPPQHLVRHTMTRTTERCAWCLGFATDLAARRTGVVSMAGDTFSEPPVEPADPEGPAPRASVASPPSVIPGLGGPKPQPEPGTGFEPARPDPTKP